MVIFIMEEYKRISLFIGPVRNTHLTEVLYDREYESAVTAKICVMAMVKYSPEYLKQLVLDPSSSVQLKKSSREVILQPYHLRDLNGAITAILNLSLCKYDAALEGLILGYQKPQLLGDKASCHSDSSQFSLPIQAEFYVFRPKVGNIYQGVVLKTSVAHVGCVLYNHFNVSLPIPPQKVDLLKTLTPQTEVTFVLEELNLTSELPFFRGQLLEVKSKSTDQSTKKEQQKSNVDVSEMSFMVKHNADASEKEKKERESRLALGKSQCVNDVEKKKSDRHPKLTLKRGEGSECAKPDKIKKRLSLKPIQRAEGNKRDTSEDNSDHMVTPYQRPSENKKIINPDEETVKNKKLRRTLNTEMNFSPLKELRDCHDDSSDTSVDIQKNLDYHGSSAVKSSQNSQPAKTSQSKKKEKGLKLNLQKADVLSKSPGGKNSGYQTPVKNFSATYDSSSEDDKSISGNYVDCRYQPVHPQTTTSPLKGKSTPTEGPPKIKCKSQKLRLALPTPDIQSKRGPQASKSVLPLNTVRKLDDSSSEDDDKSSSESSENEPRVVQGFPTRETPIASSTQKSPQKKLSQEHRVSSSKSTDKPGGSTPCPVVRCDSLSSEDSDPDTNDKLQKLERSRTVARVGAQQIVAKTAEESSEDSDDSVVEVPKSSAEAPLGGDRPPRPTSLAENSSSDSEVEVPKTLAQTRPGDTRPGRHTAPTEHSSSGDRKRTPSTSHLPEDTSSDSESDGKTVPLYRVQRPSAKPHYVKIAVSRNESRVNQTCLDGSLQSRSPLASSTPTVESCKPFKNIVKQALKRPYPANTRDVEKMDGPLKKKEKRKKDELKLTDSGFEDLKEKRNIKKNEDAKLNKEATKERMKDEERSQLDTLKKCPQTNPTNIKKHKKSKEKVKIETVSIPNMQGGVGEPVKHSKHKKDSSKTKAGVHSVEKQDDGDLAKKQDEMVTYKCADVMGRERDDAGRKSKKRKLSESKEQLRRGSSMDRDLEREENVQKKRKLFSPTFDEGPTVVDVSSKVGKSESHASKPKKSRKNKKGDLSVKFEERIPSRVRDDNQDGGIVPAVPLISGKSTLTGRKEKIDDQFSDEPSNQVSLDVINLLCNNNCVSKKTKKKSKDTSDVIPPVESIQMVHRKDKRGNDRAADTASAVNYGEDVRTSVDIPAVSNPRNVENLNSGKQLEKKTAVPEPLRQRSLSLSVDSPLSSKKKKKKTAERMHTGEEINPEKKLKKKEKLSCVDTGPARELSSPLSLVSAVLSKKKKTAEPRETEEESKSERKSKKKEKQFSVPGPVCEASPLSVVSSASPKKKKNTKPMQTEEESKSEKKSKKKSKEKISTVVPELVQELSKPLSVSGNRKKTANTKDSLDLKDSNKEDNKKRKEQKLKARMNQVSAHGGEKGIDIDDIVQSMIWNAYKDLESEDYQKQIKK